MAQVLRGLRQARGMTYDEIGYKAGISGTAVSNIENGHTKYPKADVLEKICKALGVSPLVFFDDDFRDKSTETVGLGHIPDNIQELLTNPEFLPWLTTAAYGYKHNIDSDWIYKLMLDIQETKQKLKQQVLKSIDSIDV